MEKNNKPCYTKQVGNLRLAIWENANNDGKIWHTISLTRRFKGEGNEWREAPTLNGLGDLAQASLAIRLAQKWLCQRQDELMSQEDGAE